MVSSGVGLADAAAGIVSGGAATALHISGTVSGASGGHIAQTQGPVQGRAAGEQPPNPCTAFSPGNLEVAGACCVLSLAQWAGRHALPVPWLEATHVAFVENQHAKTAHQLLRKWRRLRACTAADGAGAPDEATVLHGSNHDNGHLPHLSYEERSCAQKLWGHFRGAVPLEEIKERASLDAAIRALHGQPE
jgi:hypothetical protein